MGSKSINYDEDFSNGESSKGNDTSLIVNVNDTQSDIDDHEESNYSEHENGETSKKRSRNDDSSKRSPHKEKRAKVDLSKTRYLWVSGIPEGTKTSQLEELFLQYGKVLAIKIIRGGSDSTLLGFVKLETIEQAQKCMEKLNRIEFRGNKIELLKERPIDKDAVNKKPEKIGFRDTRKPPFLQRPVVPRPHFRPPPPHVSTRGGYRPPIHSTHREHARLAPDFRRQERDEYIRLEREKERLKLERMKLERDKAELFKIERETRVFDREHIHDDKRIRSMVKRPVEDNFLDEKRYEDFNRREEFGRRYETSQRTPERKINSGRSYAPRGRGGGGNYEDNPRGQGRYNSDKYDSGKSWTSLSDNSWSSNDNHRHWQSSSNYESPRLLSSSIGSSSLSRIHSSAELPQNHRNYFSSSRRY